MRITAPIPMNRAGGCEDDAMTARRKSALFMARVSALTMFMPTVADARPTPEHGLQTICQTNGSVSIKGAGWAPAPPGNMPHVRWFPVSEVAAARASTGESAALAPRTGQMAQYGVFWGHHPGWTKRRGLP